jgi:hypothetical protein
MALQVYAGVSTERIETWFDKLTMAVETPGEKRTASAILSPSKARSIQVHAV